MQKYVRRILMRKEYNTHLSKCYKFGKAGSLLNLRKEGATMKLNNHTNKLESHFIVYAGMESTLVKPIMIMIYTNMFPTHAVLLCLQL